MTEEILKLIHTADWHLGNQMHEIDRTEETLAFFEFLRNQIRAESAETLIISGDIFDTANPSTAARRSYYNFLASLAGTCCRNIIITGGNHDSAAMLDASKEILEALNIHVVGSILSPGEEGGIRPENLVFELFGADGEAAAICAAVPFVRETEMRNYCAVADKSAENDGICLSDRAFSGIYGDVLEAAKKLRGGRKIPLVATGHLYAAELDGRLAGTDPAEHSDDGTKVIDVVGNLGCVHSAVFPDEFDYVALGHIHYTTMVAKNPKIRYSGSPFVLGFDECEIPRNILSVSAESGGIPDVKTIRIPGFFKFRRIGGTTEEIRNQLEQLAAVRPEKKEFIEIVYENGFGRNIQNELEDTIRRLASSAEIVSWKMRNRRALSSGAESDIENFQMNSLDENEIFREFILSKSGIQDGTEESEKLLEKFMALFRQISAEEENADN